jgi:hypothetical protein
MPNAKAAVVRRVNCNALLAHYGPDQIAAATVPPASSMNATRENADSLRYKTFELKKESMESATINKPSPSHIPHSG